MKHFFTGLCLLSAAPAALGAVISPSPAMMSPELLKSGVRYESVVADKAPSHAAIRREAAADAVESQDFSLGFSPYSALNFGSDLVGATIYQGFIFSKEYASAYAGAQVTSVNITSGVNDTSNLNGITDVTVYLMDSPTGTAFRTQKGTLSTDPFGFNRIVLDEPYTIEDGKEFFVCYSCVPTDAKDYYITIDGYIRSGESDGCYVGYFDGRNIQWQNAADQVGNLCMGMTVESADLPQNGIEIFQCFVPDFSLPGEPFSSTLFFYSLSAGTTENLEVEYRIGDQEPQTVELSFEEPLPSNTLANGEIKDMVCNQIGASVPVEIRVTKVNGQPNTGIATSIASSLSCIKAEDGFRRIILTEEGTGTWCGWCPAGIVFMEYLKENYPDDFVRIAIHGNDEMQAATASGLINMFSGFPMVLLNRSTEIMPTATDAIETLEAYWEEESAKPAIAEVSDISVNFDSARKITVTAKTRFALDIDNDLRYGVSFMVSEDKVGPYAQTNYYAGSSTHMGGWENKRSTVSTIYDDVLRVAAGGVSGYTDSFPLEIKANEEYACEDDFSIANVTDSDFYVTVVITDNSTGSVINCRQVKVSNSGVNEIAGDEGAVSVRAEAGRIAIVGAYAHAAVYDFGGMKVAEATGEDEISVNPGMYIVNVDGASYKVMVK